MWGWEASSIRWNRQGPCLCLRPESDADQLLPVRISRPIRMQAEGCDGERVVRENEGLRDRLDAEDPFGFENQMPGRAALAHPRSLNANIHWELRGQPKHNGRCSWTQRLWGIVRDIDRAAESGSPDHGRDALGSVQMRMQGGKSGRRITGRSVDARIEELLPQRKAVRGCGLGR